MVHYKYGLKSIDGIKEVSKVVKYICNATWKTRKIEISIINSNYVFFISYTQMYFILMMCYGQNKLQHLNTSLHSSVWR